MPLVTIQMGLESIMLSVISQTDKDRYIILLICEISKKQVRQTRRYTEQMLVTRGEGRGRRWAKQVKGVHCMVMDDNQNFCDKRLQCINSQFIWCVPETYIMLKRYYKNSGVIIGFNQQTCPASHYISRLRLMCPQTNLQSYNIPFSNQVLLVNSLQLSFPTPLLPLYQLNFYTNPPILMSPIFQPPSLLLKTMSNVLSYTTISYPYNC